MYHLFIKHHVDKQRHVLLLIDGHTSRNGLQWLELCEQYNIFPAPLPSNTTNSLQPCEQDLNRSLKREVRRLQDEFLTIPPIPTCSMSLKLIILAMGEYKSIIPEHITFSVKKVVYGQWTIRS